MRRRRTPPPGQHSMAADPPWVYAVRVCARYLARDIARAYHRRHGAPSMAHRRQRQLNYETYVRLALAMGEVGAAAGELTSQAAWWYPHAPRVQSVQRGPIYPPPT